MAAKQSKIQLTQQAMMTLPALSTGMKKRTLVGDSASVSTRTTVTDTPKISHRARKSHQ